MSQKTKKHKKPSVLKHLKKIVGRADFSQFPDESKRFFKFDAPRDISVGYTLSPQEQAAYNAQAKTTEAAVNHHSGWSVEKGRLAHDAMQQALARMDGEIDTWLLDGDGLTERNDMDTFKVGDRVMRVPKTNGVPEAVPGECVIVELDPGSIVATVKPESGELQYYRIKNLRKIDPAPDADSPTPAPFQRGDRVWRLRKMSNQPYDVFETMPGESIVLSVDLDAKSAIVWRTDNGVEQKIKFTHLKKIEPVGARPFDGQPDAETAEKLKALGATPNDATGIWSIPPDKYNEARALLDIGVKRDAKSITDAKLMYVSVDKTASEGVPARFFRHTKAAQSAFEFKPGLWVIYTGEPRGFPVVGTDQTFFAVAGLTGQVVRTDGDRVCVRYSGLEDKPMVYIPATSLELLTDENRARYALKPTFPTGLWVIYTGESKAFPLSDDPNRAHYVNCKQVGRVMGQNENAIDVMFGDDAVVPIPPHQLETLSEEEQAKRNPLTSEAPAFWIGQIVRYTGSEYVWSKGRILPGYYGTVVGREGASSSVDFGSLTESRGGFWFSNRELQPAELDVLKPAIATLKLTGPDYEVKRRIVDHLNHQLDLKPGRFARYTGPNFAFLSPMAYTYEIDTDMVGYIEQIEGARASLNFYEASGGAWVRIDVALLEPIDHDELDARHVKLKLEGTEKNAARALIDDFNRAPAPVSTPPENPEPVPFFNGTVVEYTGVEALVLHDVLKDQDYTIPRLALGAVQTSNPNITDVFFPLTDGDHSAAIPSRELNAVSPALLRDRQTQVLVPYGESPVDVLRALNRRMFVNDAVAEIKQAYVNIDPSAQEITVEETPARFKVGDRVVVREPSSPYYKKTGVITTAILATESWVRFPDDPKSYYFPSEHLRRAIDEPMPIVFKVGDRVQCFDTKSPHFRRTGVVEELDVFVDATDVHKVRLDIINDQTHIEELAEIAAEHLVKLTSEPKPETESARAAKRFKLGDRIRTGNLIEGSLTVLTESGWYRMHETVGGNHSGWLTDAAILLERAPEPKKDVWLRYVALNDRQVLSLRAHDGKPGFDASVVTSTKEGAIGHFDFRIEDDNLPDLACVLIANMTPAAFEVFSTGPTERWR